MTDLPSRIRLAAERAGGLKWLSEEIDVPRKTLGNWLTGTNPKPEALKRIAEATNVSLDWLITGEGQPDAQGGLRNLLWKQMSDLDALKAENVETPEHGFSPPVSQATVEDSSAIVEKLDFIVQQLAKLTAEKAEPPQVRNAPSPRSATVTYLPFRASAGAGSVVLDDSPGDQLDIDEFSSRILRMGRKNMRLIEIVGDSMLPTFVSGDYVIADTSLPQDGGLPDSGKLYVVSRDGELLIKRAVWVDDGILEWTSDNSYYPPIRLENEDIDQVKIVGKVRWLIRKAE